MTTGTMDETFVKDFLLTYRTFLKSPSPIVERLRSEWEDEAQRNRVSKGPGVGVVGGRWELGR